MCLDLGIKPSALIGHSIGEYSALCFSGALSLEDSLNLIIKRSQILEDSPTGEMLTVDTTEENIKEYLNEKLSIAAVNDSSSCVIAGEKNEIDLFRYKLDGLKIIHRPVKSQRAFHSHLLELKKEELKKIFENVHFHKPRLQIISNLTGDWLTDEEMNNPDYWVSHTTKTVQFYSGIQKLFSENYKHFLEIGPGQNLASFVLKSKFKKDERKIYVNTIMKNVYDSQPDYEYLMRTIAKLWTVGIDIRWEGLYNKNKPKRISLPSYPFEHKRYWIDEKRIDYPNENDKSGVTYFTWNKSFLKVNPIAMTKDERYWLIFNDNNYCIDNLKDFLKTKGIKTIVIQLSDKNEFVKQDEYIININMKNSFGILFSEFEKNNIQYMNIVYLPSSNKRERGIDYSIRDITLIAGLLNVLCLSNNKFNLSFLLENAFNISGNEDINPETAAVFGFIKSIDKECKNIKTFCFETEQLNKNQNLVYSNLLGSVLMQSNENIAAFRGNSKWIPGYNQIAETLINTKDENHEKILVIGNNSKLKNNIVEELNEKKNKQIILARKEQEVLVNNDDFISLIEKQIDKRLSIKSIEEYEGLREKLDKLCGVMAANYLSKLFEWKAGKEISVEILRSKIITKHQKFFDYLLMITAEDKYITIENDVLFVLKGFNEIDENSIEEKKNQIEYHQFKSLINLLEYAVASYSEVFSGKMENVKVFNNNESEVFNHVFLETPLRFEKQKVYINTVRELLKKIIDKTPNRKINILEVGGGTGKLTGNLLPDLFDKNVEYHFTDIGKSFLADAKRMTDLINVDFMKFNKFDISQDPKKQGINLSKYDIILAYDVVHATENIAQTIHNLEMVTAPGGIMLIVESIQPRRWTNMMWGLQTGWWHFNDFRNDYLSPLLNLDDWDKLLSEFDLNFSATYPKEELRRSNTAFGLIVAQKKGKTSVIDFDIHNLQEMFKQEYENNFKNVQTHNYDSPISDKLNDEFQEIKNVYGKFDSIYLCENYVSSIPIILSDYEHYKDTAKSQIVRINKFIDSIKSSGLLEGKLNILFEKPTSLFNADQSIVSEYINYLPSVSEFDITSINISEDYFANSNKLQITDVLGTISSTQIYFSPDKHYKKKEKLDTKIDNQHNIYTRPNLNNEYCEPVNDTEFKLAEIWKFMFGIEKIGINDNFFELGGDSLMATKIITRIKNELNFVIQLPVFFQKPTIKAIAEKIISDKNMINRLTSELNSDDSDREEGEI